CRPEGVSGLNEKRPGYYIGLVNAAREKSSTLCSHAVAARGCTVTPGKAGG
ncbi:unnamed protein product, partial [Clonostachys chloroleuca]